jgi:hypothetical protein
MKEETRKFLSCFKRKGKRKKTREERQKRKKYDKVFPVFLAIKKSMCYDKN